MYYKKHVFFAPIKRKMAKMLCPGNALALWQYAKQRCKEEGLSAHVRIKNRLFKPLCRRSLHGDLSSRALVCL